MPRPNESFLDWLKVLESSKRPIPHYTVLGLELFESDSHRIHQAVQRQVKALWSHAHGPEAHRIRKARQLVDQASRHLLNPRLKAVYDAKLRAALETPKLEPKPPIPPVAMEMIPIPPAVSIRPVDAVNERMARAERDSNRMVIFSSCAAMACVLFVLVYAFWPAEKSFSPVTAAKYEAEREAAKQPRVALPEFVPGTNLPMPADATPAALEAMKSPAVKEAEAKAAAEAKQAAPVETLASPAPPPAPAPSNEESPSVIVGAKTIEVFPAEVAPSIGPKAEKLDPKPAKSAAAEKPGEALVERPAPPAPEGAPIPKLNGPADSLWKAAVAKVRCVAVSPDGRFVVTGGWDQTVRWWDLESGKELRRFVGHKDNIYDVAVSGDGRLAASCGADGQVLVWTVKGQEEPKILEGHQGSVHRVAFLNRSNRLATAGADGTVRLWNLTNGKEELSMKGNDRWLSLAVSPDEDYLATGGREGHLRVWSTATGEMESDLQGHQGAVHSVGFLADSNRLVSAGWDGSVRVWDRAASSELERIEGAGMGQVALSVSPCGRRFATGGEDGRITLWKAATGRQLATYDGHRERVSRIAFQPGTGSMVSVGLDEAVRYWQTP